LLEAENQRLKEDTCVTEPRTRKKVKDPFNDKFTRIRDIIKAKEALRRPLKRRRVARVEDPTPAIEQARQEIIHNMQRLRKAEEM